MRSVDVVKCWPFDEADEETVKTMLPPITIKKFRWWFDELELLHSDCTISDLNIESMRMKKRVDKTRKTKKNKKKKKGLKGKLNNKAPKKRSIVELFAVSPQVERVNSDDDDDDDSSYNNEEEEEEDSDAEQVLEVGNVVASKCKNMKLKKKKRKVMKKKTKNVEKDTSLVTRNATKVCHSYYRMLFCCQY